MLPHLRSPGGAQTAHLVPPVGGQVRVAPGRGPVAGALRPEAVPFYGPVVGARDVVPALAVPAEEEELVGGVFGGLRVEGGEGAG